MTFSAKTRKRFGQHWLKSEPVLTKIIEAAALEECDRILEIGPGTGVLTQRILPNVAELIAIEIDRDLSRRLQQQLADVSNFQLLEGDMLQLDWSQIAAVSVDKHLPNKVVANIPYYITGPLLERLLGTITQPHTPPFDSIVLLVQQEIADRLCATAGSKAVGSLTIKVQYLADCEIICPVPPKAFQPPPKVMSAVIRLRPRPFPLVATEPALLARLLKLGFASKRKMLRNNLAAVIERSQLLNLLASLGIADNVRAEDLSVTDWVTLSNKMLEEGYSS